MEKVVIELTVVSIGAVCCLHIRRRSRAEDQAGKLRQDQDTYHEREQILRREVGNVLVTIAC